MGNTKAQPEDIQVPAYDDIVDAHGLTILNEVGDWSVENGDLFLTKDGDFKVGDTAYNGLFRLVQTWRFSEAHLRYLFDTIGKVLAWRKSLDERLNALGEERASRFSLEPDPDFWRALHAIDDQQAATVFGASIYAGALILMLSGALLRFRDDIDGKDHWTKVGPFFNGHSVGAIIEAGANGFRHADEWAKTRTPDARQKRSQDIINGALSGSPPPDESSMGKCVELLQMLGGGKFKGLATNVFTFAHGLAVEVRAKSS